MRRERQQRRTAPGTVRMELQQELRSGNLVVRAEEVAFGYGEQMVFRGLSTDVLRGDKIGIIGPNGAGKTTLLRVLLGQLPPTQGGIRLGTNLQIAYFDQLRSQLSEDQTVQENVCDGYDTVWVGEKPQHVLGYLQNFLFAPERARTPVRFLSGGERNRLLLARLFARPANVVVLDEPTNDLDAETLELLENLLVEYDGTVLLVSHDRAFLNNVVTSTLVFEEGRVQEYAGGYDDWVRQRPAAASRTAPAAERVSGRGSSAGARPGKPAAADAVPPPRERRLSYRERQELAALPETIARLEADIADLHKTLASAEFYKRPGADIARETARLRQLDEQLAAAYDRWESLESRAEAE
jgi:ATP-binding cassette subfamily F protein uup